MATIHCFLLGVCLASTAHASPALVRREAPEALIVGAGGELMPMNGRGTHLSTKSDLVEATLRISHHERARATARIAAVSYEEGLIGKLGKWDPTGAVASFAGDLPQYKLDLDDMGWSMTKRWTISTEGGSGQDDAEVWKKGDNQECILAFRGSDDVMDFIRDVSVIPTSYKGLPDVSQGVVRELDPLVTNMKDNGLVNQLSGCSSLTVTGHSLGGALAHLFSALANKNEDPLGLGLTVDYVMSYGAIPVSQTPLENDKATSGCFEGARYYNQKKFGLTRFSVRSDFALWIGACWANPPLGCYRCPSTGPLKHPKLPGVSLFVKRRAAAKHNSRTCQQASDKPTDETVGFPLDPRSIMLHAPADYVKNLGD